MEPLKNGLPTDQLRKLSDWDAHEAFAERTAVLLGIPFDGAPTTLIDAEEERLVVALRRDTRTGRYLADVVDGWEQRSTLALHELYRIRMTKNVRGCGGPEARRWKLRLLVELEYFAPAEVSLPPLPPTAPEEVRAVWAATEGLLSVRWLDEPPRSPFPLSAPFVSEWSQIDEAAVRRAKGWLVRRRIITKVGEVPTRSGLRPLDLWQLTEWIDD